MKNKTSIYYISIAFIFIISIIFIYENKDNKRWIEYPVPTEFADKKKDRKLY